jgi:hypothetical protein
LVAEVPGDEGKSIYKLNEWKENKMRKFDCNLPDWWQCKSSTSIRGNCCYHDDQGRKNLTVGKVSGS